MTTHNWALAALLASLIVSAPPLQAGEPNDLDRLTLAAFSDDPAISAQAVSELRALGPDALQQLLQRRSQFQGDQAQRFEQLIDQVGGQRYCSASGLYWYTDLNQAKLAAQATSRPILSLRMMGYLTDEYSCANSRFFRTTLYANTSISEFLRERFVLHWQSVRPVPRVTIDYGDGRVLHRTLTGNSAHYALDANGQVMDALPGLYGPARFTKWLRNMHALGEHLNGVKPLPDGMTNESLVRMYHQQRLTEIVRQWEFDLQMAQLELGALTPETDQAGNPAAAPPAAAATRIARPKSFVELPIIADITRIKQLEDETDDKFWEWLAARHAEDAQLDAASMRLIRRQNPLAAQAMRLAPSKRRVEDPLLALVVQLQNSIAVDTVRNEYLLHRQIHQWFLQDDPERQIDPLNERVYAELFLTPSSDPWIGLVPENTYSALENNGIEVAAPNR